MFIVETQLNEAELSALYQALTTISIQGKDAHFVAGLMDKLRGGLETLEEMKKESATPPPKKASKTPAAK